MTTPRVRTSRHGFVLLTVLWVILGLSILALGAAIAARTALASARNREALTVAQWRAEGCIERAWSAAQDAIAGAEAARIETVWDTVDRVITAAPIVRQSTCVTTARPTGAVIDVNEIDEDGLRAFFRALGIAPLRADSLMDALYDWRDTDTVPRPSGAERRWYAARARPLPRNGPFADPREVLRVRGFEHFADTLALLGVETGRIPISRAPLPVVASLPGMSPAVLARIASLQARREYVADPLALGTGLPREVQDMLLAKYTELSRRASPRPERWLISAIAVAGDPAVRVTVEVILARAGARVAVVERR